MRLLLAILLAFSGWRAASAQIYTISTLAGGALPSGVQGTAASLGVNSAPNVVTLDAAGNVYFVALNAVMRLDATARTLSIVAGNGILGYSGDGGLATSAQIAVDGEITSPVYFGGLAFDSAGNLYISDSGNNRIRKVSGGIITTIAGNGTAGFGDGPALNAELNSPSGIAFDSSGNLYIADTNNHRIRKLSNGTITTVAGNGNAGFAGDGGAATSAELHSPYGVALDSSGNLYIADYSNHRVREVLNVVSSPTTATITTVAGNGTSGYTGDHGAATAAELGAPSGVLVDSSNNLYIADSDGEVRKVTSGTITTVAGNGGFGFNGDSRAATTATLAYPASVAVDSLGNVYIADGGNGRIREVVNGTITTIAGGTALPLGDGGSAANAQLNQPFGLAVDSSGDVYIGETSDNRVRKISNGVITTVAGNGTAGFSGDNGPATSASLYQPSGVAVDSSGNLYISDQDNCRVRKVSSGTITTIAGTGTCGYNGDNISATTAELNIPSGVALDSNGNLYIGDRSNNRIRMVNSNGIITTVAGNGVFGHTGDGGPATSAELHGPRWPTLDAAGNLFFLGTDYQVREVSNGIITTVAGNGTTGFGGDGGPATQAAFNDPIGLAVPFPGVIYIGDPYNYRVRKVTNGIITSIAGGGTVLGDGGPATNASIALPLGVAVAPNGVVYVADSLNSRVRALTPSVALTITSSHTGNFTQAENGATFSLTVTNSPGAATSSGTVTVTDTLPAGLLPAGISGEGWSCNAANDTCTRSDPLAGGASYPPITATVNVGVTISGSLTNAVTVSGGASPSPASAQDTVVIVPTVSCSTVAFDSEIGGGPLTQSCTLQIGIPSIVISGNSPWLSATINGQSLLITATPTAVTNPQSGATYSGTVTVNFGEVPVGMVAVTLTLTGTVSLPVASASAAAAGVANATFAVNATGTWAVVNGSSFVTINSPAADSSGNDCATGIGSVTYTVQPNTTPNARTATLTLLSGCPTTGAGSFAVAEFTITQAGQTTCNTSNVFPPGQPASLTYSSLGTNGDNTTVMLNNACGSPTTTASWITIEPGATASQFSFAVAANSGTTVLSGSIQVGSQSIAVTENPANCSYSVSTTPGYNSVFAAAGGPGSMNIGVSASTCAWTLAPSSSSLITDLSATSGTGNKTVTFTVAENTQSGAQSGSIQVQGLSYPITQAGAAGQPSYNCTVAADPARTLRAEGQSELVADIVLACSGSSVGGVMGDVLVTLSSNTTVTNHALSTDASQATTDALLLNVDNANASWSLSGAARNAWRGVIAGPRAIRFLSVLLAPETGAFAHTFRITNVRVDASHVGATSNGTTAAPVVSASVVIQPPLAAPASGAPFVVPAPTLDLASVPATVSSGIYTILPSSSFSAGSLASLTSGGPGGSSLWQLTFTEQQEYAFRPALATGQAPSSTPGAQYVAESGFVNGSAFGTETGYSNNGRWTAANAAMGTRLMATLANVPCSVSLYAPVAATEGGAAQLVSADGTGSFGFPVVSTATVNGATADGYQLLTLTPSNGATACTGTGSATVTWEVTSALAGSPSALMFELYVYNPSNASLSAVTYTGGPAPQVTLSATSTTAPVPRFNTFQNVIGGSAPAALSFFFVPTGAISSSNTTSSQALAAKLPASEGGRKLAPETTTGGSQCSQTATATITNTGTTVAANTIATIQGSGPLSGCFGPTGSTAAYAGSACTVNLNNAPAAAVYQIAVTSTACTPFSYSGYTTSGQGNSDPNSSDQAAPAAPIVNLYTLQTPTIFTQGDLSGDDTLTVSVINTGDDAPAGSISVVQTLPPNSGLVLTGYSTPAGDPYSQYWVCTTTATTATCTYGNNPNLTPSQEPLLNSSKLALGSTRFILSFQTATTASANVTDTLQLNTDVGGNLYGTSYTPTIAVALQITAPAPGSALPQASVGVPYTGPTFRASGGSGSYTWSATGLPSPLTMNAAGVITGTPTAATATPASITVTVADANNASAPAAHASYTLSVGAGGGTTGLAFYPVTPCRVVDTRAGQGFTGQFGPPSMTAGQTRGFTIPASGCNIPATAQAYSLNVTVVPPAGLGYLTIWPAGQSQPVVSTLNSSNGAILANAAIVPAGTGGGVSVFVTDATDLIVDIDGYFAPPAASALAFYPVTPCRVADTRNANGPFGGPSLGAGGARSFTVPQSSCGIPSTAQAYSLNMTVVPPGPLEYLTTWPTGQTQPVVSTLNALQGQIAANAAIVPAGTNGAVSVFVSDPSNVIIDINGYFAPPGSAGALYFYPLTPCRIADTRNAAGTFGGPSLGAGSTRTFPVPGSSCSVPTTAQAYSFNMTVVPPGSLLYLSTWPAGQQQPVVSTLNDLQGQIVANAAIVPAGASGGISVFVSDTTNLIIDINGYFGQ